jgi:hypothetical protein
MFEFDYPIYNDGGKEQNSEFYVWYDYNYEKQTKF